MTTTMTRKLTDRDMLRAAERSLAEHQALRPATNAEAAEIAAKHRAAEAEYLDQADALSAVRSMTTAERVAAVGRGQQCIDLDHQQGREANERVKQAMSLRNLASRERMAAESWERVAGGEEGEAYRATEVELAERVAYYAKLCAK